MMRFTLKQFGLMLIILGLLVLCTVFYFGKQLAEKEKAEIEIKMKELKPQIEAEYRKFALDREDSIRKSERLRYDTLVRDLTKNKGKIKVIFKNIKDANNRINDNPEHLDSLWHRAGF